ncbi:MAG: hypothetical protein PHF97_02585 [Bacteroidales bacterium]|nr:hypothetical protein [Bacteroidales bacterium]MDD4602679.1 hypothetical protein [Bacteroidales bacterium]
MKKKFSVPALSLCLLLFPFSCISQIENIEEQIEKTVETMEVEQDYSDIVEDLTERIRKPLNLNAITQEKAEMLPYLTQAQRKGLLDYVNTYGELFSIYELASIPGFDSSLIRSLEPYITIAKVGHLPKFNPKNLLKFSHYDLLLRYEQTFPTSQGYLTDDSTRNANPEKFYPGSPQRYYFRLTYRWFDKVVIGFAGEKDPGEQFFKGAQSQGMDYYAAYLALNNLGILKNLVIGNYRITYGQGLTLGSGLSFGATPGFSVSTGLASGMKPSLSMSEEVYFRGIAATLKIRPFEGSGFISYHSRDATISQWDTLNDIMTEASSLVNTGYHRTPKEIRKKNVIWELVCGGNLNFNKSVNTHFGFKAGITGIYYQYNASLKHKVLPYNQFTFSGSENYNLGFDFQMRYRSLYIYGEVSRSANHAMAWLAGANYLPDPRVSITMIYRNYAQDHQNLFSNAFGQNSVNANERGIYLAINAALHTLVTLSAYGDLFTFPWLKNRTDAPTRGQEWGVMINWQTARYVRMNLRYYQKNISGNRTGTKDMVMHKLVCSMIRSIRFNLEWNPLPDIILKSRFEVKEVGEKEVPRTAGYLICQDLQVKPFRWPITATLRYAIFDIPCYDGRIYVYEPEVLYGYSVPSFEGKGMRICMVLKAGIGRHLDLWIRGGLTYFTDREVIGTDLDQTIGNTRSELTGQLLIRF